jgi:hypothetical protein
MYVYIYWCMSVYVYILEYIVYFAYDIDLNPIYIQILFVSKYVIHISKYMWIQRDIYVSIYIYIYIYVYIDIDICIYIHTYIYIYLYIYIYTYIYIYIVDFAYDIDLNPIYKYIYV